MKNTDSANRNIYVTNTVAAKGITGIILDFLLLFMPSTMAKRVVCIILVAAGTPIPRIVELTGLTDRSVKSLGRTMKDGDAARLLEFKGGRGRRFVTTFSGRKRYNVPGAMDFVTKKVPAVANDSYITATEVCDILVKISKEYGDKTVHLVLGNARYQKCKAVRELVSTLNIHLEYISPYSPNLNLIERL